jgi:hypothetical protein
VPSATGDAKIFPNIGATTAAFELKGGKYGVAAFATGAGTMGLQMVAADGSTLIPVHTVFAATLGYAAVDLPPGQYKFFIATFTAVYATICRVPS